MDIYANANPDELVDSLSYKLAAGSQYITDKNSVTFFPSGSNIYTNTAGTKVLRILINGDGGWLDPSTVKVLFDVRNNDTVVSHSLRVLGGPSCFWRRLRILAANQLVEDIDYYNRLHWVMDKMRARQVRENEDVEGFDTRYDQPQYQDVIQNNSNTPTYRTESDGELLQVFGDYFVSVIGGQAKTVAFKPVSGLLSCNKLIPLKYCPLVIELELCSSNLDPIVSVNDAGLQTNIGVQDAYGNAATTNFSTQNTSILWQIENPQIKCDVVTIDNSLENEYAALLLSGKSLPVNYSTFITQLQSISGANPSINITRALSRLKTVFVTFDNVGTLPTSVNNSHVQIHKKSWNDLYHPMTCSAQIGYDSTYECEYQLQINSHLYPNYPIRSIAEAFTQLRKCMGIHASSFHSFDITPFQYRNHSFILGFDMEKNLGTSFTGLNIKNGSLITLKTKGNGTNASANTASCMPDTVYLFMHADCILSIRDSGVEVFD
jgi:hypothetical protein